MQAFFRKLAFAAALVFICTLLAQAAPHGDVARGAKVVRGQPTMNPPVWSAAAFDNLWKVWGLKEKPADFARLVRERYGVHEAAYDNGGLPMGLHHSQGLLIGKGIVNDCLLCHASVVAGQTVIGAPNASLDLQSLFDDLRISDKLPYTFDFQFSRARGTIDPVNPTVFLMSFRDADLNVHDPVKLDYSDNVLSDPPAWWLLKRKKTRNWNGGVSVDSMRVDMVNLLTPFNSPEHIKKHESTFADIHAFVMQVESPKYPFPIDTSLAEEGRGLFKETCAKCHGTYGPGGQYPSKIVPYETLGTDRTLASAVSPRNLDILDKSWFAQEKAPDGSRYRIVDTGGYQAPPLDGVWATAPYFHNSSVPTIAHVLDSKSRPTYFTRSFGTAKEDYDPQSIGWKTTVLSAPADAKLPGYEQRKVYDTTLPGRSNAGHTFGDRLSDAERRAVIEYLKTL
jgi:mono/diheme cytochrome c family protein